MFGIFNIDQYINIALSWAHELTVLGIAVIVIGLFIRIILGSSFITNLGLQILFIAIVLHVCQYAEPLLPDSKKTYFRWFMLFFLIIMFLKSIQIFVSFIFGPKVGERVVAELILNLFSFIGVIFTVVLAKPMKKLKKRFYDSVAPDKES